VGAIEQPELADLLVRLGIHTLGALAALPAADVTARFGPAGAHARRLAAGLDPRPPDARRPPPELLVATELDPPALQVEQVAFVARPLAEELVARLTAQALACTRLRVEVETEHDELQRRCWRDEGTLTPLAMAERVRWQLDGWLSSPRRPTGGISWLRLVPEEVVADQGAQQGFWGGRSRGDERAGRALARVEGLLGPEAVTVPVRHGGRSPAEQVVRVPASSAPGDRPRGPSPDHPSARRPQRRRAGPGAAREPEVQPWPGRIPPPAPAVVHLRPLPAALVDAHDRLVVVSGRGMISATPVAVAIDGRRPEAVVRWAGPWVADERWWDGDARRRRARLQVVTPTGAHLLALEGGRWWAEATYD
jgi:protein ImuB